MVKLLRSWGNRPHDDPTADEEYRARLLIRILRIIATGLFIMLIGDLIGGQTPALLLVLNSIVILFVLFFIYLANRGWVKVISFLTVTFYLIILTVMCASLGTIRTPTTASYLTAVVIGGLLFDFKGVLATTVAGSLSIMGLIWAENQGLLPTPTYTVTITQWVSYTILIGFTGYVSILSIQTIRRALLRAENEIAERKQAETALQQSEKRFRALVEQSQDVVIVLNARGEFSYIGPNARHLSGYTNDETLKNGVPGHTYPDDLATVQAALAEVITQPGLVKNLEFRSVRKDGSVWWVDGTATNLLNDPDVQGIVINYRDVTVRKRQEEALRLQVAMYENLFQNASIGIMHSLPEGKFLRVNPAYAAMMGYESPEEMIRTVTDIASQIYTHPGDRQEILERLQTQNEWVYLEQEAYRKDGSIITVNMSLRKVLNPDGSLAYIEGFAEDISQRKQAYEAARLAQQSAELANQAKSIFMANMSHELRTPLNAILGFTQVLEMDAELNSEQKEMLSIIEQSGDHLLRLINSILDLTKIEAGRMVLNIQPLDLLQTLEGVEKMFQERVRAKQQSFNMEIAPDMPCRVTGDEMKISQVLMNLIGNAIKFTPAGGKISVRAGCLSKADHEARVFFEIEDTGQGIPEDERGNLFRAFVQTSSGIRSGDGSGLGLAISREYARLMNGDITVTSKVGVGSTFCFEITLFYEGVESAGRQNQPSWTEERFILQPAELELPAPDFASGLARLSIRQRQDLRQAIVAGKVKEALHMIDTWHTEHGDLARQVEAALRNYQLQQLVDAIEQSLRG